MSPTPPKLLSEKQLDEFDALADYFVMLWAEQERGGLSKHAQHDQKTHGKWASGPGYSSKYNNRAELVAIRGYQARAIAGESSGWNPEAESVAERMAGVTTKTLLSARKLLAEKWQVVFPEQVDPELKQQRQQLREEARLRRAYQRMNVEPMPPSVKGVFDRLKQSHDEIVGTFPYTTTNVFSDLMEGYAEEIGMPVEVARKEFRNMRRVFDPLGLHYPELAPPPFDPYPQIRAALAAKRMRTASPKALQAISLLETPGGTENKMLGNTAAAQTWEAYIRRRESQRKWTERKITFRQALDGDGDGFIFDGTPLERRVTKHARHDQKDHGKWARGRSVYEGDTAPPVQDVLDTEGLYSPEANRLATQLRAAQEVHEPAITKALDTIAVNQGGMLESIGFRLKTTKSIARKIDVESIEQGISRQEAAQDMKDVLRYTYKFPERQYTQRVSDVYAAMEAQGFVLVDSKNYWRSGDAYDGLNANFLTPQGFLIEVQFHTPSSLKMKDPSHKLYELYRGDEKALSEIGLSPQTVTESQRKEWWDQMVGMWLKVNRPKGILEVATLKDVVTYKPLAKAAFRYFAKMDGIGQPRAYYRLAKGKSQILEERWDRVQGRWVDDKNKSVSWWMVSGEPMELEEIPNPGLGGVAKASGGLSRWFKEEWVDISRPKKGGGFEPCGRKDAGEGKYPKCVPKSKAMKMSQAEIDSAVRRKRRAESTQEREGKKPINVSTSVKKSKNIPSNPKLYAKVKAEAKRKFDVYPSAYANGWLVQEYKRRGGTYKTVEKQQPTSSDVHVPSADWKFKRKKRKKKFGLSGIVEKHAQHDQKDHGKWARGGGSPKVSGPTAKRDAHISQYGLMWTEGNDENPDVLAAKRIPDELWRKRPKEMFDPSELHPTEEWIGSRHVDKVVSGREPFREGYDPYVIRDRQGKLWIVDGHHRAAMYAGLGQKMPAHVWDWGLQPSEAISRWEETIKIARRRMNNLSADYPGNEQVQSLERERMAESIASMEAKVKELEAERKRLGLSKHAQHDQQTHGNWANARSGPSDRPESLGTYRPPAEFDDRIGRCYELSWRTVTKMPERGRLVHGSIQGAGNERIPHSWTEVDDLAYDPVMNQWLPADSYRSLVNAEVAREYTKDEVEMIVSREMNMGPWHKEPYGTQWYEERGL
jgi:hypothetical protein